MTPSLADSSGRTAWWKDQLADADIPVLRATLDALAGWRAMAERADANSLADTILRDPLMTLNLLIHVSRRFGSRLATPVETVTAALVLLGIEPFFNHFSSLTALEDKLADTPHALFAARNEIERSHHAARLAAAFAIERQDCDAEVLHQAALLDNFAGLLVCCESPSLYMEMARRQQADTSLRSAEVQRAVLGVELPVLEHALMSAWGLADVPSNSRCVALAVRIARHSQVSWANPALPDDYAELGELLNIPAHAAAALVRNVADWGGDQEISENREVRPRVE